MDQQLTEVMGGIGGESPTLADRGVVTPEGNPQVLLHRQEWWGRSTMLGMTEALLFPVMMKAWMYPEVRI